MASLRIKGSTKVGSSDVSLDDLINGDSKIGNTNITLNQFLTEYQNTKLPHFTETASNHEVRTKYMNLGRVDDSPMNGSLVYKSGYNNDMKEWFGGVYIPDISKYYALLVEVNSGGNGESQFTGGIYLWDYRNNKYHSRYNTAWRERILMPKSSNYTKVIMNKFMLVENETGPWVVCCLLSTYTGIDIAWNSGFGSDGTTMRVIGLLK